MSTLHELAALAGERALTPEEVGRLIEGLNCLEVNQVVDEELVALCRAAAPLAPAVQRALRDVADALAGDPEASPGAVLALWHHVVARAEWDRIASETMERCLADPHLVAELVACAGARVTAEDVRAWSRRDLYRAVTWAADVACGRDPVPPGFLEVTCG